MKIVFNNVYLNFMGKNIFSSLNYEFTLSKITLVKGANGKGRTYQKKYGYAYPRDEPIRKSYGGRKLKIFCGT